MDYDAVDLVRESLWQALLIAGPILGAGLLIGLAISLLQAVTQIQEQTLTFVPKIMVMIVVAVFLLGWIVTEMLDFATRMFASPSGW